MGKHTELFAALMAPFVDEKIRPGQGGQSLRYITAAQAMNRLDEVLGPENWEDKYELCNMGAICTIKITLPDETVVAKQGFGGGADMADGSDDFKSVESDAFKRAATKFGVGRYLRGEGIPAFAAARFEGHHSATLPANSSSPNHSNGHQANGTGQNGSSYRPNYNCPRSGKALFAWMKERQDEFNFNVLGAVNKHPQIDGIFPGKMTEWDDNQVAFGYAVMKKIWQEAGVWPNGQGDSPGEVPSAPAQSASARGAVAAPEPIDVDALKAIKTQIKEVFVKLINRESPGVKVTAPVFMAKLNSITKPMLGFEVENMVAYTDLARLKQILSTGSFMLTGAAAAGGADDEEIPF